ncbi:MAG TPA: transcription antitermination factor NusB [Dongiaceae bacterium]|nr:transcription antitermination factor NusB [Dongiaceae bacterium]
MATGSRRSAADADARAAALAALVAIDAGRAGSNTLLADLPATMPARDRGLATELVYGVLRRRSILDRAVAAAASRPLARISPLLLNILRLAAYQLLYLERIPVHAIVDEAVGLARRRSGRPAAAFANGLLRGMTRRGRPRVEEVLGRAVAGDREAAREHLAIATSFPRPYVDRVLDRDGDAQGAALLEALNAPAPVVLRAMRRSGGAGKVAARLRAEGIETTPSPWLEEALRVAGGAVPATPTFRDGWVYVQDEAAQILAALLLPAGAGDRVIDFCAAPGGKAILLADHPEPPGLLVAADASRARLRRLCANAARLGIERLRPVVMDGARPALRGRFERLLVDAPCSGTGVIRRHPEIRWRFDAAALGRSAARQRRLIAAAADLLAPGGRLVYSVCSLEPEEGPEIVDALLAARPDLRLLDARTILPERLHPLVDVAGRLVTRPGRDDLDGFFAAVVTTC